MGGITDFRLYQNYPNPFNPSTTITYTIATPPNPTPYQGEGRVGFVTLKVYDVLGREIATLVNEEQQAGIHHYTFSILHSSLSSGIYFYQLKAGSNLATKKMVLLR